MPRLFAGTSGFAYPTWKPGFYPKELPARSFLEHYATRLNCVESNYTFRRMPTAKVMEQWAGSTPDGFVFAVKAPMRITHILRLREALAPSEFFLRALEPLRATAKLGPVLFQLPPKFPCDAALLRSFLAELPRGYRYTFEFRDTSWFTPETYDILREHGAALCWAESEKLDSPRELTADFVYRRLRQPEYSPQELQDLLAHARTILAGGDVYLIFKHEDTPEGALNAERMLAEFRGPPHTEIPSA